MRIDSLVLAASSIMIVTPALAVEYPIGDPQTCGGMEIAAVYLQPIEMDPPGVMLDAAKADIHLEADIHATEDNKNGFEQGSWMPYLSVQYELKKDGSTESLKGMLHPMVANDGPHYGENLKIMGAGKYHLTLTVNHPTRETNFGRHVDKETGVAPWFSTCVTNYDFTFAGTGKKGGY